MQRFQLCDGYVCNFTACSAGCRYHHKFLFLYGSNGAGKEVYGFLRNIQCKDFADVNDSTATKSYNAVKIIFFHFSGNCVNHLIRWFASAKFFLINYVCLNAKGLYIRRI